MSDDTENSKQQADVNGGDGESKVTPAKSAKVDFTPDDDPSHYKYFPDDPNSLMSNIKFNTKGSSQFYDPCEETSKMSFKCLEENNYDKSLCKEYFKAYKDCKRLWMEERKNSRWR